MEDTVSELLELARLDEAAGPRPLASLPEVDLDELVLDDTVQQRRVPVDTARVSAGRVHGRREQLTRVVRNLLDNAARHATHGGRGRAGRPTTARSCSPSTTTAPGIPVEDRERVFDRFTRLDDGPRPRRRRPRPRAVDGEVHRRSARRLGRDRGRAARRRPGAGPTSRRLTSYRYPDARADRLQLQLPRRAAGPDATARASPYDLDAVLLDLGPTPTSSSCRSRGRPTAALPRCAVSPTRPGARSSSCASGGPGWSRGRTSRATRTVTARSGWRSSAASLAESGPARGRHGPG